MKVKKSAAERIFDSLIIFTLVFACIVTLYPFIYVASMSISDPNEVIAQKVWLLPKGFSIKSYELAFRNPDIWRSFYNSIWYTGVGTLINVVLTVSGAYPLSRKEFFARGFFMLMIAFTMFFGGGLIPVFILINKLGLYNTRWALVFPGAVAAWYLIIARVYFQSSIPDSLPEAAKIDGCSDIGILFRIIFPVSMPIVAVLTLFYAVAHWNSYLPALIYIHDQSLQPIQVYLMKVLSNVSQESVGALEGISTRDMYSTQMKYSVVMIVTLPIILVYPFLQKYFVKGVMIGAIKE